MHFEFLVEDASGKIVLESLVEKILGPNGPAHTFKIIPYKGIGRLPKGMTGKTDASKRILLDRLPQLLGGYGKSWRDFEAAIVVVVDFDDRDCGDFKREMMDVLARCEPAPTTFFRIAIEEMEWCSGSRITNFVSITRRRRPQTGGRTRRATATPWLP
jgi:hypothetical protein